MNTTTRILVTLILALQPLDGLAATPIGPNEFEQIWLLNNQRNLIARYHQRAEQFRQDERPLFRLDIDAAPNQTILTFDGPMDAILDRIGLHYQSPKYLFLVDWLSLIPQPQTTEGYTYGDAVLGRSWLLDSTVRLTLGIRMQTSPNSVQSGGQTVFNVTDNASHDTLGGFAHINYGKWDLGTYYSRRNSNQANSLKYVFADTDTRNLYSTLTNLRSFPERNITSRNELALNLRELISQHQVRGNVTITFSGGDTGTRLSNAYITYLSPEIRGFRFSTGVYHTYLIDSKEGLVGAKLGMEYRFVMEGDVIVGAYVRKNAFGDTDAMVLKSKPVYSFTMTARY